MSWWHWYVKCDLRLQEVRLLLLQPRGSIAFIPAARGSSSFSKCLGRIPALLSSGIWKISAPTSFLLAHKKYRISSCIISSGTQRIWGPTLFLLGHKKYQVLHNFFWNTKNIRYYIISSGTQKKYQLLYLFFWSTNISSSTISTISSGTQRISAPT